MHIKTVKVFVYFVFFLNLYYHTLVKVFNGVMDTISSNYLRFNQYGDCTGLWLSSDKLLEITCRLKQSDYRNACN